MVSNDQLVLQAQRQFGDCSSKWELEILIGLGVCASTRCAFDPCPAELHVVGWGGSRTHFEHIRSNSNVK